MALKSFEINLCFDQHFVTVPIYLITVLQTSHQAPTKFSNAVAVRLADSKNWSQKKEVGSCKY